MDSGVGIPVAFLPHVFDRFSQADSRSVRTMGGLGLGLAIAKQLVELHGGTIRAESPGTLGGATFTVRLPVLAR
jgi:signal transduction histidine kinase